MKKLLSILFVLGATQLFAQTTSSLYQVMSSSSMLDRPEVFREMQLTIYRELGDIEPIIGKEIVLKKLEEFNKKIKEQVDKIKIELNYVEDTVSNKDSLFISYSLHNLNDKDTILTNFNFDILNSYTHAIKEYFNKEIINSFRSFNNFYTKEAINYSLIKNSIKKRLIDKNDYQESYNFQVFIEFIIKQFIYELRCEIIRISNHKEIENIIPLKKINFDSLNIFIENKIKKIKEDLVYIIDNAEYSISGIVDEASNLLALGNIGVAITEGQGNFAGGINILWKFNSNFQFGIYTNGQFSSSNQTNNSQSQIKDSSVQNALFGAQARAIFWDCLQFDALFASLFFSGMEPWKEYEWGLGLNSNVLENLIVGFAFFSVGSSHEINPVTNYTLGVNFKGINNAYPSFLFGARWNKEETVPILQISFPIIPTSL